MTDPREIDLDVEVSGTPAKVWDAVATGPGISAWMQPTEVQEEVGGRFAFDTGDGTGTNETGRVAAWEPPTRFTTTGVQWAIADEMTFLATDWTIEPLTDRTCKVRMVMSGFPPGEGWDREIAAMTPRLRTALDQLGRHLRS